jgi:hypothetical protein
MLVGLAGVALLLGVDVDGTAAGLVAAAAVLLAAGCYAAAALLLPRLAARGPTARPCSPPRCGRPPSRSCPGRWPIRRRACRARTRSRRSPPSASCAPRSRSRCGSRSSRAPEQRAPRS